MFAALGMADFTKMRELDSSAVVPESTADRVAADSELCSGFWDRELAGEHGFDDAVIEGHRRPSAFGHACPFPSLLFGGVRLLDGG